MKFKLRGCPRADELHALVRGDKAPPNVSRHVARCDTCSQIVESLRRDVRLIEQLRSATKNALNEETHRDVLNACRAALDGLPKG